MGARCGLIAALNLCCLVVPVYQARADDRAQYSDLIDRAVTEYRSGNFAEARTLFLRAHEIDPNARTLRGLGLMEFELRNYPACIARLEQALASTRKPLEGKMRKSTEELLTRARAYVSQVDLQLEPHPEGVRVLVDGVLVALSPSSELTLTVGEHLLEVAADGYAPEKRKLSVLGGERRTLAITLRPAAPELALSPDGMSPATVTHASPRARDDDSLLESPWFWTGVAAVVAGGVVTALLLSAADEPVMAKPVEGDVGGVVQALAQW